MGWISQFTLSWSCLDSELLVTMIALNYGASMDQWQHHAWSWFVIEASHLELCSYEKVWIHATIWKAIVQTNGSHWPHFLSLFLQPLAIFSSSKILWCCREKWTTVPKKLLGFLESIVYERGNEIWKEMEA